MVRISTDPADAGFVEMRHRFYEVRLNGKIVKDCLTADTEEGFIVRLKRGKDGNFKVNKKTSEIETETKTGTVTVKYKGVLPL